MFTRVRLPRPSCLSALLLAALLAAAVPYQAGALPGSYRVAAAVGELQTAAGVEIAGSAPPAMAPGAIWEHTFATEGSYPYYDPLDLGMTGTIDVLPGQARASAAPVVVEITITAAGFQPASVTIAEGDTVRWTNSDDASHAIRGGATHARYLPLLALRQ